MSRVQCIRRPVCNRVARRLKNWEKRGRGLIERAYSLRVTRMRELVVLFSFVITTPGRHHSATQIFAAGPRKYHRVQRLFFLSFPFFPFFFAFVCRRFEGGEIHTIRGRAPCEISPIFRRFAGNPLALNVLK